MTFRTVLTMLEGTSHDTIDLEAVRLLAANFGCHVDLLHVRRDGLSALPMIGDGLSADVIEIVKAQTEKVEQAIAAKCREVFDSWLTQNNITEVSAASASATASARLIDVVGQSREEIARLGKFADLVVLSAPSLDDGDISAATEAAIYDTGRPVLFSPRQELKSLGKRVSIFWNDTVEASRAAQAAIPFLQKAEAVQVMAVDDDSFDPQKVSDCAAALGWRGIKAEPLLIKPDHQSPGEALLDAAWDFNADLIVMGAFSHSRLREMILGGVTRHILQVAGRPVLMMH